MAPKAFTFGIYIPNVYTDVLRTLKWNIYLQIKFHNLADSGSLYKSKNYKSFST